MFEFLSCCDWAAQEVSNDGIEKRSFCPECLRAWKGDGESLVELHGDEKTEVSETFWKEYERERLRVENGTAPG